MDILDNLVTFGKQFENLELDEAVLSNAKTLLEGFLRDELITNAEGAIEQTPEFQYPPLRDRLLANLSKKEHYRVSNDLGSVSLFDEGVGGTVGDLIAGQQAAWKSSTGSKRQRLFCWIFGIYKPFEGIETTGTGGVDKFEDYPSYQSIINIRLDTWKDKAPYWRFLEYGNAGGNAYPSFSGTGFISNARGSIHRLTKLALRLASAELKGQLEEAIEEQLDRGDVTMVTVVMGRVSYGRVGGKKVQVEAREAAAGGVWYRLIIGGRYGKRIEMGAELPTGKIFRGF